MKPRPLIINGWFVVSIVLACILVYQAHAATDTPRYVLLRGNATLGTPMHEYPCEQLSSLYENGRYIGRDDSFPQVDYRIIDWETRTIHNIYEREYGTVLYVWRDFTLGPDGHPHPAGAWVLECEFSN